MKVVAVLSCLVLVLCPIAGYPDGPPLGACVSMFPTGHNVGAQTSAQPYELLVSADRLTLGGNITVTLRTTGNPLYPYFEGMFVQARMANCESVLPVGRFIVPADDTFMKLLDCHTQRPQSAVSQKVSQHETSKSFIWTAPMSEPGRIYFRATVVKNQETFWTDIFSSFVEDDSDTSQVPSQYCTVQKEASSASSLAAFTSLLVAAVVTSFRFY